MTLHSLIDRKLLREVAPREKYTKNVLDRLNNYELKNNRKHLYDEEVWTLLFVYGFSIHGIDSLVTLASVLTGNNPDTVMDAWLEMKPIPPRKGVFGKSERNSQIDLLIGDIKRRGSTISGVEYLPKTQNKDQEENEDGWVCFVEAKWLSDIAIRTTHDWGRNQLARVIETALTFQGNGQWPSHVHVTLLTPTIFSTAGEGSASRLYAYKWREYVNEDGNINPDAIRADINRSQVDPRTTTRGWTYPEDLDERLRCLSMHWVTYEELLSEMPQTRFKSALCEFVKQETQLLQSRKVT